MRSFELEGIAGWEDVSAELREYVEEAQALTVQAAFARRFELEEARDAAAQPPDVGKAGEGPAEGRVLRRCRGELSASTSCSDSRRER
jgi:hypothetical protein